MANNINIRQVKQRFGIIGNSPLLDRAIRTAVQVAPTDLSVLVTGESGSGKEFFPQIIHQYSSRKHNPYIAVNCGAIPEGTIDSELFGHKKGSFTGALADRKGYFEEANGGTIFLDEVGELPLSTQARLLRVLETGEFIAVGASTPNKTDVRIVAATNVNLTEAVQKGKFREDLLFRLNTVPIVIPPLRERAEDAPLLFRKFASDSAEKYRMPTLRLTPEAEDVVKSYRWPGNIRELRNVADRMSVLEEERSVSAEVIKGYLPQDAFTDLHPVLLSHFENTDSKNFSSEREILYQVLFDMKKDMNELKSLVQGIMDGQIPVSAAQPEAGHILHHSTEPANIDPGFYNNASGQDSNSISYFDKRIESHRPIVDVAEIIPDEDSKEDVEIVSISEAEAKLVKKALQKYGPKNKKEAADALGISERTLYRKIKDYNINVDEIEG